MPIRAITFDAANTLFHPNPSVGAIYREVMARHGLDYPAEALQKGFRQAFVSAAKDFSVADGERREWLYWRSVVSLSIQGLSPAPANFDALFEDLWQEFAQGHRWRVDPQARSILQRLRRQGLQLALLTNWDRRVRQVVTESPLHDCLDHLFISSEIGYEKPDSRIFLHAQQIFQLPPHQIAHLGDSPNTDIQGAESAGWHAILLAASPPANATHATIPSLQALPAILQDLP